MPILQNLRIQLAGSRGIALVATLAGLLSAPYGVGQDAAPTSTTQGAGAESGAEAPKLTKDQLESLVAPLALYPDPLLAQCLVASTYPLDIVSAQQWLDKNSKLKGDELAKAAEKQDWDPSVQALVSIPDALKRLSENIKWTADLGDAFLAQEEEVMDAVQALRAKAKDAGKLDTTEQQKVETKTVESKTIIEIQPASTQVVYVPTYNPVAYWPAPVYPYPPVYYPPYYPGQALISFGVGMAVGAAISGGWGWGCGWGHGGGNTININNNNNYVNHNNVKNNVGNRSGNSNWQHNAQQRGGAPYKDKATASKYGGGARGDSASTRQAQAQSRQGQGQRSGAGASSMNRGGGASSSNKVGNRSVSPSASSRSSSSAFGGSQSGSRARSSSSRGSSSMSSMSRGGGSRGGGGGRRR